jgi:hypothetical protein
MSTISFRSGCTLAVLAGVLAVAGHVVALDVVDSAKSVAATPVMLSSHTPASSDDYFVVESHHQVFSDFVQVDTVKMNQKFSIGEGEEEGEVILFNPHFSITDSGRVLQLTDTLYNPAVRIRVTKGDSVTQESWAFYFSSAPHFRRSDMLGFRLLGFKVSDRFVKVEEPKPVAPIKSDSTRKSH